MRHDFVGVSAAFPVVNGEIVDVSNDGRQSPLGAEHHVLVRQEEATNGNDATECSHDSEGMLNIEHLEKIQLIK